MSQSLGSCGRAGSLGVDAVHVPLTPAPRGRDRDDPSDNTRRRTRSPIRLTEQPQQQPAVAAAARTPVTWAQALTTIEQLLDQGATDATVIARRLGIKLDTLYMALRRYERDDLWRRMTNRARARSTATGAQVNWATAIPLIEQLLQQGITDSATIAAQVGLKTRGLYSSLHRYKRDDLWRRMTNRSYGRRPDLDP